MYMYTYVYIYVYVYLYIYIYNVGVCAGSLPSKLLAAASLTPMFAAFGLLSAFVVTRRPSPLRKENIIQGNS